MKEQGCQHPTFESILLWCLVPVVISVVVVLGGWGWHALTAVTEARKACEEAVWQAANEDAICSVKRRVDRGATIEFELQCGVTEAFCAAHRVDGQWWVSTLSWHRE